jgi:hypothetical protein
MPGVSTYMKSNFMDNLTIKKYKILPALLCYVVIVLEVDKFMNLFTNNIKERASISNITFGFVYALQYKCSISHISKLLEILFRDIYSTLRVRAYISNLVREIVIKRKQEDVQNTQNLIRLSNSPCEKVSIDLNTLFYCM